MNCSESRTTLILDRRFATLKERLCNKLELRKIEEKRKIHKDKNGRDYIKESYFVDGKMKFRRIYLIDGIPEEDFFKENASDIDPLINGE